MPRKLNLILEPQYLSFKETLLWIVVNNVPLKSLTDSESSKATDSFSFLPKRSPARSTPCGSAKTSEFCECPDFETRRSACKHVIAVRLTLQRELNFDGTTTITETIEITKQATYPQEWTAYNAAQNEEKDRFQVLLRDLCSGIQEPMQTKGRPRLPPADQVFCAAFKVYSGFAARRFASDLREAEERKLIQKAPHFNSVLNALENPDLRPILTDMIETSALPLQSVETDFAADSTGFSTCRYEK
jgi:hypothetical protein